MEHKGSRLIVMAEPLLGSAILLGFHGACIMRIAQCNVLPQPFVSCTGQSRRPVPYDSLKFPDKQQLAALFADYGLTAASGTGVAFRQ